MSFYRDVLGLSVLFPQGLETFADQMWVTFDTGICTLALHGDGQGDFGRSAPKFVFEVEDVKKTRDALIKRGVPMSPERAPSPGVLVSDGQDPEGNHFSIESRSN